MKKRPGSVRIIGGKWRGRRLTVPDLHGLRPSGDRARETLFNWLQPWLRDARCADLFAGTAVLGLEAASRGAAEVILVELNRTAARSIRESLEMLGADNCRLIESDALTWLRSCEPACLDIVFIDPPFDQQLESAVLTQIRERDCLVSGGLAYVETARDAPPVGAGEGWETVREKDIGDVRMQLLKKI